MIETLEGKGFDDQYFSDSDCEIRGSNNEVNL